MIRKVAAIAAGILIVGLVVMTLQWVGSMLYPLPEGVDPMDPADRDAFLAHVSSMPLASWGLAFVSEVLGAFLGALAAGRIAQTHPTRFAGVIVGVALLGSIMNWMSFPHPVWFIVGQLVAYLAAFMLASRLLEDAEAPAAHA